jgi:hypothetical protein
MSGQWNDDLTAYTAARDLADAKRDQLSALGRTDVAVNDGQHIQNKPHQVRAQFWQMWAEYIELDDAARALWDKVRHRLEGDRRI